jgi:hypothetical protein
MALAVSGAYYVRIAGGPYWNRLLALAFVDSINGAGCCNLLAFV